MKLVYCWINRYLNIKNQGFNFGSEYIYTATLNSKNILNITREKNENYIENYFKIDENAGFETVTAIVGENGAGKSMIIKNIIALLASQPISGEMVLVFEIDGHYKIVKYLNVTKINENLVVIDNITKDMFLSIYYNPIYDFNTDFTRGLKYDISSAKILEDDIFKKEIENINIVHTSYEIIRGIDFINQVIHSPTNNTLNLPFKLPKYLNFYIYGEDAYVNWDLELVLKGLNSNDSEIQIQYLTFLKDSYDIASNLYSRSTTPFNKFLLYFFKLTILKFEGTILITDGISLEKNLVEDKTKLKDFIIKTVVYLKKETEKPNEIYYKKRYEEILNDFEKEFGTHRQFQIEIKNIKIEKPPIANKLVHNYINLLKDFGIKENLLSIYWDGISTGEKAFLNLFSRFYSILDSINFQKHKYLYIFIDEGELGFHFQWQQKYLDYLIKGLSSIFQNKEDYPKMQLIFTTHSPIVLSDMPDNHVIFIKKEKEKDKTIINPSNNPKTFAANIHDILKHDFFMDNGFMGEHVKNKLNEVIYFLNCQTIDNDRNILEKEIRKREKRPIGLSENFKPENIELFKNFTRDEKEESNKNLKAFINNIDEPILKIKLKELYYKAISSSIEKGRLIQQKELIEKRLEELQ